MTLKTLTNRKKPNYATPRYSRKFNRISKPNSLRSKVFEFMNDYPMATPIQLFNLLFPIYKHIIYNVNTFKNNVYIYRNQYKNQFGTPYTPNKKQLTAIRKGYDLPFYSKNELKPDPEVVATKKIEDEQSELERLKAITNALRSRRY